MNRTSHSAREKESDPPPHLERRIGLLNAFSINMSNMVGSGTFVALPLMLGAMGGPQALIGWVVGAIIAFADGLVWSELATTLPGSGGTYVYVRESFGSDRWGRLWSFLFVFQMVSSGPLEIASGNIAIAQYTGYILRGITPLQVKFVAAGVGVLGTTLLYRRIKPIVKVMFVLWVGMLMSIVWVILAGASHFSPQLAFSFPPNSLHLSVSLMSGVSSTTLFAMYCYLGYYGVCYLGDEVINPARTVPRSVLLSVAVVALMNLLFCLSIVGVMPWREVIGSEFVVCEFMQRIYGHWAGAAICLLMIWTSFGGIYAMLLTYSRIPYAAARDGNFFRIFGRLHAQKDFPHFALLLMGGLATVASFLDLAEVITALIMARILVQFVAQIIGLMWLRSRRPEVKRPFRMMLYPVPCAVALCGWMFIFLMAPPKYIVFGLLSVVLGCLVFLALARRSRIWPFGRQEQPAPI
jgi:amino acid transporter